MRSGQRGFTLIELVVVLTIIAVLAAIALPRFVDLQRDARIGHLQGARGAVASGVIKRCGEAGRHAVARRGNAANVGAGQWCGIGGCEPADDTCDIVG